MLLGRDRFCVRKRCSSPWSLAAHASVKPGPGKEQGRGVRAARQHQGHGRASQLALPGMQQCGTVSGHCHMLSQHWVPGRWASPSLPAQAAGVRQDTAYLLGC